MTTTNKNHLNLVNENGMAVPSANTFNLGYINGELTQMDDTGDAEKILTESSVEDAVRATVLTGLSTADSSPVTASDTVLEAFGKLQAQEGDFVPTTRKINGYELDEDVTLTTDDISEGTTNLYNRQADFAQTDSTEPDFIKNKGDILNTALTGLDATNPT
ncbi:MAG: hypothetical protein LBP65_01945, partial [Puniceicoccales bacterium]|nr:hypothetical protein [Puniceicoccales bacterium]